MNDEMKEQWRETLENDDAWNAVAMESPPPLTARFRTRSWWPAATAAATVLLVVSLVVNVVLVQQVSDARTDTLLALLKQPSPMVTLASIEDLRNRDLSAGAVEALRDVVRFSEDPNAQLSALEALYELRLLDEPVAVQRLLAETRSNLPFMRAAIRAMTEESI